MPVKKYKPVTPGQRGMTGYTFEEITKSKPERSLLLPLRKQGGRNVHGRVTVRHRGGGHRRRIRIVDFKRDKLNIPAKVAAIEYDPNRTARLALLNYADGEKRYILAPLGVTRWRCSNVWPKFGNSSWKCFADFQYSCWYNHP